MKTKPIPLAFLAIAACWVPAFSQGADVSPAEATARIVGELQDGTPPPQEPAKPGFSMPARDVLESTTHRQGEGTITIQKVSPIALPKPQAQESAPYLDLTTPAMQQRIAQLDSEMGDSKTLCLGATIYHSSHSSPRSLVQIWPDASGKPVTFWSSADFSLLSGFSNFVTSSGETISLMMMWSVIDLDQENAHDADSVSSSNVPEIPVFPAGKASFIVSSGEASPETLADLQALHDLYQNEFPRLKAAHEGRERARLEREAYLKANPPKPQHIVLNYWSVDSPAHADKVKGGSK